MDTVDIQVSDEEKALVDKYAKQIKAARKREEKRFQTYETNRRYYRGTQHKDGSSGLVRTNIIFSTIATLYPQIYAKNPDISLTPGESVTEESYEQIKMFGKTAETVLDRQLVRGANLKKRAKSWVRAAMLCQVGWLKVTYQKDVRTDPLIKNRMDDIQDNIQRLQAMSDDMEDAGIDRDLRIAEMQAQMSALAPGLEIVVSSGTVIDKIQTEDLLILDPSIRDFDDYVLASAIDQQVWMTADKFEATFGRKPATKANKWYGAKAPGSANDEQKSGGGEGEQCFVCVNEIWAHDENTVYTWCDGEEGWCREPYQPDRVGKRWYPFFGLCFNPVDGEFYGVSDVELLIELQEEYSRTRTNLSEHRKYTIPIRVVRAGGSLSPEDVENIKKAKHGDTVVVGGDSSIPLQNDVTMLTGAQIDPSLYDVTPIRADIELVSGSTDANRGNVLRAKTATEAEIMQQGMASRTSERQDIIEDVIEEIAEYVLQSCIKELTIPEVKEIAGEKAVWPLEPTDDALNTLRLEIRAGSTGKPDRNRERDQWLQLMPVIQTAMEKVMMLREAGQNDMADAVIELTRESLRRFDERIDIDSLLPRKKEGVAGQEDIQALKAENDQLKQALPQMMQQLEELQKMVDGKQQEIAAAEKQAAADRASAERIAQINAEAKVAEGALAEALSSSKQMIARIERIERALQQIPMDDPVDKDEIMLEVHALLDAIKPEAQPQEERPIIITVPVTVEGRGAVTKTGKAVMQEDGSFMLESVETPVEPEGEK